MAYSKQTWDTTSYVNPTRMNHIEDGIASASTADGTEYSSGVSVKDALDIVTAGNIGNGVGLLTYNTSSNMYTAPCDGYILLQVWSSDSTIDFWIGQGILNIQIRQATMKQFALFARKGTSYWLDGSGNNRSAVFFPLVI